MRSKSRREFTFSNFFYTPSSRSSTASRSPYLSGFFTGRCVDDEILRPVRYGLLPTKSCPPFTVKVDTNDVSGRKGNNSKRASAARCSPSDNPPKLSPGWNKVALLTAARNSPCSCPFSVSLHPPQAALNSEPRKRWSLMVLYTNSYVKPPCRGRWQ